MVNNAHHAIMHPLVSRTPIVAVLGHVNHGKSTLLDYIRKTKVAEQEAGGITQRLGAYEVVHTAKDGARRTITFLDTPGHEAFAAIRERGAATADIAILVVSGEEGVKPQTLEALRHITAARIPYIVAITKIDKPNAEVEQVKQCLAENKIFVEGYGGDIPCVPVSSKTGEGISELLEMVLLVADLNPAPAHLEKTATGFVIESHCASTYGVCATLLIKNGTLRKDEFVVAENRYAPVRFMENSRAEEVIAAVAGQAVRITGWNGIPRVGSRFTTAAAKKKAEDQVSLFSEKTNQKGAPRKSETAPENNVVTLPVIIKADSGGSLEALEHEIIKQQTDQVALKIVSRGIGALTESDLKTAVSCRNPIVIGFAVGIDPSAKKAFERSGIRYAVFDVIYKLTDWVAAAVREHAPKTLAEKIGGSARILKLFSTEKGKQIIGGRVLEGEMRRGDEFRVLRRDAAVGSGKIRELQLQKKKIESAPKDSEFGALASASLPISVGDIIEAFTVVEK